MLAAAAIGFTSCNDSFMERYPDTSLTEQTVFSNYNTFKTYAWGLYGVFTNTNILRIPGTNGAYASATSYTSDIYAGYLMRRQGDGNPYAFQNVSSSSSGNGWAFSFVYRVNVMLANIDNSGMTDADKEHWRSVGYFFRAYYYDAKKNKKRSVFSTVLLFGFFIILMVCIVGGMFAYLADSLCKPFAMVNMKWLYFLCNSILLCCTAAFHLKWVRALRSRRYIR